MSDRKRGGKRVGAGRKPTPLFDRKVKRSVSLSLTAIEAVRERQQPGEEFSTALDRILNALPVLSGEASTEFPH
jgi:hypothetical protein